MSPNPHILIIDDNRAVHEAFRKIFCPAPPAQDAIEATEAALFETAAACPERPLFELESAYQGQEALELTRQALGRGQAFAVAFVDVRMPPGWDGLETTTRLWQVDPDLQVVICTAYVDYSWEELTAKVGRSDRLVVLKKPFEPVEVLQLASALAEKWRLHQEAKHQMDHLESLVRERTRVLQQTNERLAAEMAERKRAETERERLIAELKEALASVRTLSGLIPICAGCKKIRDDRGYWKQVETYLGEHSDVKFTHGLCPECTRQYFPDEASPAKNAAP